MKLNTLEQSNKTKIFVESVKSLIEKGKIKSYAIVAGELGINPSMISNIKNGRENISNEMFKKFSDLYGITNEIDSPPQNNSELSLHILIRSQENLILANQELHKKIAELEEKIKSLTKNNRALEDAASLHSTQHISAILQPYLHPLMIGLASKFGLNENDLMTEAHNVLSFSPMVSKK